MITRDISDRLLAFTDGVKFFKDSRWITVVVDDLFPCCQNGGEWVPLFCRPSYGEQNSGNEMELWAMIVEKAFAKMHGCYQALDGGSCGDACSYLTGGDVVKFNVDQGPGFFDDVVTQLGKDSYVSCSVRPQAPAASAKAAGLVPGHAYAVLHAVKTSGGKRLLMLKNPHGGGIEWNGDYSDGHSSWTKMLQQEVDRKTHTKLGTKPRDDGSFWMSAEDFTKWFADIGACNPWGHGSTLCAAEMKLEPKKSSGGPVGFELMQYNPVVEVVSAKKTTVHVSIQQSDIRGTGTDTWPLFFLYSQEEGQPPEQIITLDHRTEAVELDLPARKPVKLIATAWKPGHEGTVWISVTSQGLLDLERVAPVKPGPAEMKKMAKINEPPTCYVTKKPVDFAEAHFITDHGFVFKEAIAEYEQESSSKCGQCGKACVGQVVKNPRTGQKFCSMDCAKASSGAGKKAPPKKGGTPPLPSKK